MGLRAELQEGKLRILQYDRSHGMNHTAHGFLDENMLEVKGSSFRTYFW